MQAHPSRIVNCGGCGKSVQSDWSTCPFCSCEISKVSDKIVFSDNVVMGDIKVNDLDDITKAVGQNSICKNCNSMGSVIIACSVCKELSHCDICKSDLPNERVSKRLCSSCYDELLTELKLEEQLRYNAQRNQAKIIIELRKTNEMITEYRNLSNEIAQLNSMKIQLEKTLPALQGKLSFREAMLEESRSDLKIHSKNNKEVKDTIARNSARIESIKISNIVTYFIFFTLAIIAFAVTYNYLGTSIAGNWLELCLFTFALLPIFSVFLKQLIEDILIKNATNKHNQYMNETGKEYLRKLDDLERLVLANQKNCNDLKRQIRDCKKVISVISSHEEEEYSVSKLGSLRLSLHTGGISVIRPIQLCVTTKNQMIKEFHQKLKIISTMENKINDIELWAEEIKGFKQTLDAVRNIIEKSKE